MPYTVEQYKRDYILSHLKNIPAEEVLSHYKPEDRLAGLRTEDVLSRYKPEQIEKWLASQKRPKRRQK